MSLIEACVEAFKSTQDSFFLEESRKCLSFFLGRNDLNLPLYDFKTGGCHDALESFGVNHNQGAEATLSWLISLLTMYELIGLEIALEK